MYVLTSTYIHTHLNKNFSVRYIILVTLEDEEAGLLQSHHKHLKQTLSQNVKRLEYSLVIEHFPRMCEALVQTPKKRKK